jgi:endonuclease G, mitochondrial
MLVSVDEIKASIRRFNEETLPGKPVTIDAAAGDEALPKIEAEKTAKGTLIGPEENRSKRREMLRSMAPEPVEFAYERAIGENDSVYSNFVELIAHAKQKVGRIVTKSASRITGYATGFMVSESLMLTNWHVFKNEEDVEDSEVEFFYELDIFGRSGTPVIFKLNSKDFFYSNKELDYCFIAVNPVDVTGKIELTSIGYIYLDPTIGKLGDEGKEELNIVHHPDGDYKQLSIRENLFIKIMEKTLWYESDTAQGSSGSPVFNDQWQLVALHHMGVPSMSPDGQHYLDKNKKIIPEVNGKIDISKIHWIANEGIRISVIIKDIFNRYPDSDFISKLKVKPAQQAVTFTKINKPIPDEKEDNSFMDSKSDNVHISFPASLIQTNNNVTININNSGDGIKQKVLSGKSSASEDIESLLEEAKKIEREDAMDFSKCKGYDTKFLGVTIPIPKPKKSMQKFVAKLKGSQKTVLDYYHYSLIFHSVRMQPIISAVNVEGNPDKRLDKTKRVDDWLRDNRLDYDIQLTDKYYAKSGFDRGHMSRREDANWGDTAELAKLYADVTCMYTNACPQVAKLNQSKRGGLWGKLEIVLLEKGAEKQAGKEAKVVVFNGPIFKESDSVYKGIQIPLDFWKIILWFNDDKELKATAFKLSQKKLVGDIDFEAIDIDKNMEFQEHQCSIKSLEKETGIEFSDIAKFDTFDNTNPNESLEIHSEAEVEEIISKNKKR